MHNSVNRKGVNFKPFDALEGYKEAITKATHDFLKEDKMVLSEDQEEDINSVLVYAINNNRYVMIKYYDNGFYKYHSGRIMYSNNETIYLNELIINLSDIAEANLI